MNDAQLDFTKKWFADYVRQFRLKDGSLHPMHAVKVPHSASVSTNCRVIATELGWTVSDIASAQAMGLLHDAGRFPQFRDYGTFSDARSTDHGKLGCDVVQASELVANYSKDDMDDILDGIRHHNKTKLASCASPRGLAFLKLIRDADKLDIIKIMGEIIHSGDFTLYPELLLGVDPNGPPSQALISEIANSRTGSYANVHSLVDFHLIRLSWMFDLNYQPSLKLVVSRGLMAGILRDIPDTPEARKLAEETEKYLLERVGATVSYVSPA